MQCTQRKNTIGTYRIISTLIPKGFRVLDYGAGYCLGAILLGADSYEPMARIGVEPTFRQSHHVPEGAYDAVVCNCVLNVLPNHRMRNNVLECIVKALRPGGVAFIMVRSWNDIRITKNRIEEGDGYRLDNGAFQRGFTFLELDKIVSVFGKTERISEVSNIGIRLTIPD